MPYTKPCLPGIDCGACGTKGFTRGVWRPSVRCSKASALTPPDSESIKTVSVDEFRNLLGFCEPKSPPIYPGTFIGNEPVQLPEKSPWSSCLAAPHLKRKQPLIRASGLSVAVNERLAEVLATDDSVSMTPVVFQSKAHKQTYYVPELAGKAMWAPSEYEYNRIVVCTECGCHNFGSGLGTYKVRQYEGRFATDEARMFYCLENNSLVVSAAMKSKLEQAERKLKFALRGKV